MLLSFAKLIASEFFMHKNFFLTTKKHKVKYTQRNSKKIFVIFVKTL
jgi:hypothetical protein